MSKKKIRTVTVTDAFGVETLQDLIGLVLVNVRSDASYKRVKVVGIGKTGVHVDRWTEPEHAPRCVCGDQHVDFVRDPRCTVGGWTLDGDETFISYPALRDDFARETPPAPVAKKFASGAVVRATETERGERFLRPVKAVVFEDFGTAFVSIKFSNGQLHTVPRRTLTEVK